jgi:hypothetical protein
MTEYWDELDNEILELLRAGGAMDPVDLGRALRMSPAAVCSCLAMLSADGKVRIRTVEATPAARCAKSAA